MKWQRVWRKPLTALENKKQIRSGANVLNDSLHSQMSRDLLQTNAMALRAANKDHVRLI